ncbi:MAG: helix-turn-helix domain-containing protein, partial [Nitrospinae bacterium]|nr:helix-turn-helix domain-containing protein [Nitrospinota bacterium]
MSKKGYKHLSSMERDRVAVMSAQGASLGEIGARLGRDKS